MEILKVCHCLYHLQTIFLPKNITYLSYFLSQHFIAVANMFNFCFFPCQITFFCILHKRSTVSLWSFVINEICITLETAQVILPFKVKLSHAP